MTIARLLRSLLARAARDPLGAIRLVTIRLTDEPAHVLVRVLGLASPAARRRLAGPLRLAGRLARFVSPRGGWQLLWELAALDVAGDRARAVALANGRGAQLSPAGRLVVAGWLAEVDRSRDALALVDALPPSSRVQRVRGRIRWRAGDWLAAREELAAALRADRRATTRRTLHRIEEDLRALDPAFAPATPAPAGAWPAPTPGRAVHLVNNSLPYVQAGYTLRSQRVALAQRAQGIDPVMVTRLGFPWRQGHRGAPDRGEVDGVPYVHVHDPDGDTIFGTAERVERSLARLGPRIADLRPAVLHPTTPFDNAQVALALGATLDVPVVYEVRGFLEETWLAREQRDQPTHVEAALASDRYRLTRETEGRCAERAAHVVTLGEAMKADLVARGVPAERITVVPNAVDLEDFQPSPERRDATRARLGVPEARVLLGYVSSLVAYEGVEVLLGGARELLDRGADVGVLVVGDGAARAGWEREAAELGLGDRCRFTGRVPHAEVHGYYEAIDVFVVPRRDQRVCRLVTPLKPVEAMALERCVVVADLPALAEMVTDGVTGVTFAAEDPVALADVVAPLVDDRATRARLGAAAREQVAAERSWAANGRRYADLYDALGVR